MVWISSSPERSEYIYTNSHTIQLKNFKRILDTAIMYTTVVHKDIIYVKLNSS